MNSITMMYKKSMYLERIGQDIFLIFFFEKKTFPKRSLLEKHLII